MWRKILLILTILVAAAMILCIVSVYVSPAKAEWMSLMPFALKYVLIGLAVLTIAWLFLNYKIAIPVAVVAFVGFKYFSHEYSFRDKALDEKADFSVMSYNVKCFGILDKNSNILREKVLDVISSANADIVCLQEAYWADKPTDFPTLNVLSKNLNAKQPEKLRLTNFNHGIGGLAIVTRYKVINKYTHPFDSTANGFMYVDILMKDDTDTVRLYNCHMQSIMINDSDVELSSRNEGFNRENKDKAVNLYSKLSEASARRAKQVDTLVATLDTCPYPVILCGDFNDIPLSYTCFSVLASGNRLHDTFMERGNGSGRTYSIMNVDFRIDYIMHSNDFKCLRHKVIDFNISDDHYPVKADFKM